MQAEQYRITVLEGIKTAGTTFGQGFREFINDPTAVAGAAATLAALALGVYGAR